VLWTISRAPMSERKTEKLISDQLTSLGYTEANDIIVEAQKSDDPDVNKLLKGASKTGKGGKGAPEFIVTSKTYPDLLMVVECKADVAHHASPALDQPVDYAVDGAIHYARHLAKRFNVIAVGASGQTGKDLKVSLYLVTKGSTDAKPLLTFSDHPAVALEPLQTLHDYASRDPEVEKRRVSDLMSFARDLHNFMRDYAKLSESEKPLLISGILIALQDRGFRASFSKVAGAKLPKKLTEAIRDMVEDADIPEAKKSAMLHPYSFIAAHPTLGAPMKGSAQTPLQKMVADINEHVFPFITKVGEDIVGRFYGEFLRYTGGDGKGLGIVLTPRHVTELFCDLAELTADDVVLDTCCGTAGFLISAMHRMLNLPGVTEEKRAAIRANQLVGVEQQPNMYALAASNMILRGDGKANLFQASCFDAEVTAKVKALKPTVGFINPPYSQKGGDLHEFNFIEHMLDCLEKNGRGIAIVPMNLAVAPHPLKQAILEKHTLEAVVSMPDELFYPVGTVTCIMVFRAGKPHDATKFKTWFGYWKDDGFVKTKNDGRIDKKGNWASIRDRWLEQYRDRDTAAGQCIKAPVTDNDEWCAEAYLETDYGKLSMNDFEATVKDFLLFRLLKEQAAPTEGTAE
jgi:type I restriction enzyme M protein